MFGALSDAAATASATASGAVASAQGAVGGALGGLMAGDITKKDLSEAKEKLTKTQTELKEKLQVRAKKVAIELPKMDEAPAATPSPAAPAGPGYAPVGGVDEIQARTEAMGAGLAQKAIPYATSAISIAMAVVVARGKAMQKMAMQAQAQAAGRRLAEMNPEDFSVDPPFPEWVPMAVVVVTVLLNTAGIYFFWNTAAMNVHGMGEGAIQKAKDKIGDVMGQLDDKLALPVKKIEAQIDEVGKDPQNKKVFSAGKKFESATGTDVPDPEDLKKPLNGIPKMLEDKCEEVKKLIYERIGDMIPDVIEKKGTFWLCFILIPVAVYILAQVVMSVMNMPPDDTAEAEPAATRLLSSVGSDAFMFARSLAETASGQSKVDNNSTKSDSSADSDLSAAKSAMDAANQGMFSPEMMALMWPYMKPVVMSCGMTILFAFIGWLFTQRPVIMKALNYFIGMMEGKVNGRINSEMSEMLEKIFGGTFDELNDKVDDFFPRVIDLIGKLQGIPGIPES